jgi:hypothetical protein
LRAEAGLRQAFHPIACFEATMKDSMPSPNEGAAAVGESAAAQNPHSIEFNRRHFLRTTLFGASALFVPVDLLEALEPGGASMGSPVSPAFAAFRSLAPGAVRAEGWLAGWLGKQVDGLGYHLPDVSWPFSSPYWQGLELNGQSEEWWPWEQKAYWIDGATRLALVTGDERLLRRVHEPIDFTLAHQQPEGYLGPEVIRNPEGNFHRWPHTLFFRGLAADADALGSGAAHRNAVVEAMHRHYLADMASYGVPVRNITNVEDMLWCYERTGDPRLLAMAEMAWADYSALDGEADGADLQPARVYGGSAIKAHGVSYAEISKQPAILYMYTGKPEYLKFALAAQKRIFDHHMLVDGIPSTSEHYSTVTALDSHETCDITDHTWTWGYMLMATGDGLWGDRVERACFNAGMGAIKKDWKGLQYFSCPNQFIATQTSDHNAMNQGHQMMSYQPNPGHATACCGGDVHRLFPNYVIRMWMHDNKGGLAATLYGPCRVSANVGPDKQPVEIVEETDYPFGEYIHFTVNTKKGVEFPLSLRIPQWCASPSLMVNGMEQPMPAALNGFITLTRKFHNGDQVKLTLPMSAAISKWPDNATGIEHGPLVFSLPIKEKWTPVIEPKWSSAEFPSWDALPDGVWNYGLAMDSARGAEQVLVHRKAMTPDPWIDPPIALTVPARLIEAWKLATVPIKSEVAADMPGQLCTPPLPAADVRQGSGPVAYIGLVPYGSTHLRLTIFPHLTDGPATGANARDDRHQDLTRRRGNLSIT